MTGTLVVEDDEVIGRLVAGALDDQGHRVTWCTTGEHALRAAAEGPLEVCIVDLGLPDADGLELVRSLRRDHPEALILVATARGEPIDVVAGLDAGADDYVVKPFTMMELLARLRAHRRRLAPGPDGQPNALVCGATTVDLASRSVTVGGAVAPLREREFQLMELLARAAGRAVSRHVILTGLWADTDRAAEKSLNVTLTTLRHKLHEAATEAGVPPPTITTLRGFGYRLELEADPDAEG